MPPSVPPYFTPLESISLTIPRTGRGSWCFAFLRRGSFVLKRPFHCIAGRLEFDQRRKLCWFLLGTYHCRNHLASLLPKNLAKSPQVLVVVNCHSATPLP